MVCAVCGGKTTVINSRLQKRNNQVWRRRQCLACGSVFTTHETPKLEAIFMVERGEFKEPFLPDKLFTEILLALQDRKDCYTAAREVSFSVIQRLRKNAPEEPIEPQAISFETGRVLKRLDKRAWLRYVAEHPSLQPIK